MKKKPVTGKPELLKRINRNMIIKLIMQYQTISRSHLAKLTELALPSVMRIVDGLIEEGLVLDIGKGESTGGRKPNLVMLNKDALYIFGVEIAVNTVVILSDLAGNVLEQRSFEQDSEETPEEILIKVHRAIEMIKQAHELEDDSIAGVGIGTPGTNFKHIHAVERSILKGWESFDVEEWFKNNSPHMVEVENVARTRTLSELWFGKGKEIKSFMYVFVDRGVGCGIVNKGVILKGAQGVAGELGHTVIAYGGRQCYCGQKGCLEMYVSSGAITNAVQKVLAKETMNFSDVVAHQTSPQLESILKESGEILGIGIANLINVYNPEAIVLGGVVPVKSNILVESALATVERYVFNKSALNTPVYVSEIDHEHTCIGSVALVMDRVFKSVEL